MPEYEDCDTEVELTPFEEYEFYNRSLGFIAGVLSILPTAIFIYPVLLTSPDLDILRSKHKMYMSAWIWTCSFHMILFMPLVVSTILLANDDKPDAEFYEMWLTTVIMPFMQPLVIFTEVLWLFTVWWTRNKEDTVFAQVYPILVAMFYLISTVPTIGLLKSDSGYE